MPLKSAYILTAALALASITSHGADKVTVVDRPDISGTNRFYIGNRAPLEPARFLSLPTDAVLPQGWLLEMLQRERAGLCGHLGEISAWLQKDDNAWLSKDGKGKYGWEEVPYWLRGYLQLGYVLNDTNMLAESQIWIEGAIHSQRPDGDFGPDQKFEDDGTRDFWANMLMLFCLETYYDHTHDQRVLDLMTKYFHFQAGLPDEKFLTHYWQKMRGGDTLYAVYWLYNRTGDPELLKFAEKIHRCTANWEMKDNLPNWHNVNIVESFREPAEHFLLTHDASELHDTYADFFEVRKRYGQVPGGMFGGDENCRAGYTDPHQGVETCGMVEQMLSDEMLMQISGDPFWADNCEDVAFNSFPAALTPDLAALRYLTAPNLAVSDDQNHSPGVDDAGPFLMMNPFSSRCCQHNHGMGWPYLARNLWLATPDNGLCASVYSANEVTARVGKGATARIEEETKYPFEESVKFTVLLDKKSNFPLYLRIPAWCQAAVVSINGKNVKAAPASGKFVRIQRDWKNGDEINLTLPMQVSIRTWAANHDSVSVNYGPLTFSLKLGERYERKDSSKTAIGDSAWQKNADPSKWPSFEIYPETPWNYGLMIDPKDPAQNFTVKKLAWPANNYPFTPDGSPIEIVAKGRQIPEWTLDYYGLCGELQPSPAYSTQPVQDVTLIPMGATRVRVAALPTVSDSPDAYKWHAALPEGAGKPKYHVTTSYCFEKDSVDASCDGIEPVSSGDQTMPRLTWWDHRGTSEWVQYDFDATNKISSTDVYWYDDTGIGQCRVPKSWQLFYQKDGLWIPVGSAADFTVRKDGWNHVAFPTVEAKQVRLEVQLQSGVSGGILEWKIGRVD